MLILGLNLMHGDASAAIVQDGEVVFAVAEERLNRIKHYAGFPISSIRACLEAIGAKLTDIDHVAIGSDKNANLKQKAMYTLANPEKIPNLIRMRQRQEKKANLREQLAREFGLDSASLRFQLHPVEHHLAHIASAYYCSPWEKAAGLSYDSSGDFVSTMWACCNGLDIEILNRVFLPHSLGSFYTTICEFIGYCKFGDEGKVMGLAPYGKDTYLEEVSRMVYPNSHAFKMNPDYFMPLGSNQGLEITPEGTVKLARHYSNKMIEVFGEAREPYTTIEQREMDLAWAMQRRFEEMLFYMLNNLHKEVPLDRLVMAGGCALNSVANGRLFSDTPFRETWIQPAAGDEGLSVGAALYVNHAILKQPRRYVMKNAYLGPEFSEAAMRQELERAGLCYQRLERGLLLKQTAQCIAQGDVVGWFQGRMEWGPRALGNRSILAHPGLPDMKDVLNARIKHREWFRPFAPAILVEHQNDYFEHDHPSPFMLHVYKIRADKREELCAVNHVDNSGRLQSVAREDNPDYHDLIQEFNVLTGTPVVLNTSFNENEPIVCTPKEAVDCFVRTKMDVLVLGPYMVLKDKNSDSSTKVV